MPMPAVNPDFAGTLADTLLSALDIHFLHSQ